VPGQGLVSPHGDVVQVWPWPSQVFSQGLSYFCLFLLYFQLSGW